MEWCVWFFSCLGIVSSLATVVSLDIPASTVLEFKYIRKNHGIVRWEDGPNRQTTTPTTGSVEFNDVWRDADG